MSVKLHDLPFAVPRSVTPLVRRAAALWRPAAAALVAFLAANAPLLGGLHPLGLCVAAAVAPGHALLAAAGAAAGYAFALDFSGAAPYLAAVAVVALLRALAGYRRWNEVPFAPGVAGALCLCLIRLGLAAAGTHVLTDVLSAAAEGLIALGISYLLSTFFAAPHPLAASSDPEQRAAACFAAMAALVCLAPYSILGLYPARCLAALTVLLQAHRKGAAGCTAAGAAAVALCAADAGHACAGLALMAGGLAAGLFFGESRGLLAMVFCGAGFLGVLCAPDAGPGLLLMAELCLAALVFTFLPERLLKRTAPLPDAVPAARAACTTLSTRLDTLGRVLNSVGGTIRAVCTRMPAAKGPALADAVAERCCASCADKLRCWADHSYDTYDAFAQLEATVAAGEYVAPAQLPGVLASRCRTPDKLARAVNAEGTARAAARAAAARDRLTRGVLCEQYGALAGAMGALARETALTEVPDRRKARRLELLLRDIGLEPVEVSVAADACGRLTATACLPPMEFSAEELDAITAEAAALCRRSFSPAQCSRQGAATVLTFRQAPRYRVAFGLCGLPAKEGDISADAARVIEDGMGRACAVLCDGMGTGKAAAVDGTLAAQLAADLLGAGFPPAETARLVNTALALKGGEEAATTLDILRVDLYTGDAELYKAGAAPSFVVREAGAAETYLADSVPIGILGEVRGRQTQLTLLPGDTAVLATDGALAAGPAPFADLLCRHRAAAPQALAEQAALGARAASPRPDDITVLALRLEKYQER